MTATDMCSNFVGFRYSPRLSQPGSGKSLDLKKGMNHGPYSRQ